MDNQVGIFMPDKLIPEFQVFNLQAMKDIRSQYGDNVIVEFSGDGMAALVKKRKGQVDEAITDEQRAASESELLDKIKRFDTYGFSFIF